MRRFEVGGIELPVPDGWEARGVVATRNGGVQPDGSVAYPYVHLANFPLPSVRAPYGSGVVGDMGVADAFAALIEFEPSSVDTALFAEAGPPRRLAPGAFSGSQLQRTLKGQLGCQRFFNASDRAMCLYVVLGGREALRGALPELNRAIAGLRLRARSVLS